jgi:hypothetical protein
MKTQRHTTEGPSFIGIDYHKRYSVFCVVDGSGEVLDRGKADGVGPIIYMSSGPNFSSKLVEFGSNGTHGLGLGFGSILI